MDTPINVNVQLMYLETDVSFCFVTPTHASIMEAVRKEYLALCATAGVSKARTAVRTSTSASSYLAKAEAPASTHTAASSACVLPTQPEICATRP